MIMNLCLLTHDTKTRTEYVQERKALVGNKVYLDNRFWEIERVDFPGVDSGLLKDGKTKGRVLAPQLSPGP